MKFGVIGNNPLTMSLLLELAGSDEHSLVVGAISDRLAQSVAAAQISMRLVSTQVVAAITLRFGSGAQRAG